MTKRITKINIDGEEYSVGDGGGEELEKLKKYVRPTPDTEEGTSAQFGIFNDNHQTYIQIDSNKTQSNNEYIDNITINNNSSNAKPNIDINAKSVNVNVWDFLLNTNYGKICLDSDNKIIRIGSAASQESENINILTFGDIRNYCLTNNNMLFIGKSNGIKNVSNSIIVTDSDTKSYNGLKNSIIVGEDIEAGNSAVMIGKGLKGSTITTNYQIIFGQYNSADSYSVFQIGDGQGENDTHNLFKIDSSGKAYLSTNKIGNQGVNGPGYVVRAPSELNENENSSISSSCWPFKVITSSGSTPVRLTYEKEGTTITSSFTVSAKNSNYTTNSIKLTSDEDGTKTVTLSDPSAWREALGITNLTPSYFRRIDSVSTAGTWRGLTLNSFPAEGTWVIIFRAYALKTNLGDYYFHQQIKINDEILYEGTPAKGSHVMYNSDKFFGTTTIVYECTTSTKLECLVSKSGGNAIQIYYDVTGFKIS